MVVVQDGAADNGQIGVGTQHVVGQLPHEGKELLEGAAADLHGGMLGVEDDAVLLIISIGRILDVPVLIGQLDGHHAVILSGREVAAAAITGVFNAQHALGIADTGSVLELCDLLGVLFGL